MRHAGTDDFLVSNMLSLQAFILFEFSLNSFDFFDFFDSQPLNIFFVCSNCLYNIGLIARLNSAFSA